MLSIHFANGILNLREPGGNSGTGDIFKIVWRGRHITLDGVAVRAQACSGGRTTRLSVQGLSVDLPDTGMVITVPHKMGWRGLLLGIACLRALRRDANESAGTDFAAIRTNEDLQRFVEKRLKHRGKKSPVAA